MRGHHSSFIMMDMPSHASTGPTAGNISGSEQQNTSVVCTNASTAYTRAGSAAGFTAWTRAPTVRGGHPMLRGASPRWLLWGRWCRWIRCTQPTDPHWAAGRQAGPSPPSLREYKSSARNVRCIITLVAPTATNKGNISCHISQGLHTPVSPFLSTIR